MFITAPALLPSVTHHTERRVASTRWRSPSSVPPAPRAGGRSPVTTASGTVGEGLQRPRGSSTCLRSLTNELNTDVLRYLEPPLRFSRASGRSASARYPSCPLIDRHAFRAAVMNQIAPRTAYPVDLAVSRETCSALRWYSVSTVRTPLYRLLRRPHAPMRRQMHSQSK